MHRYSIAIFLFCSASASAFAQSDSEPLHIGSVDVSGNLRERYESWDWFPGAGQNAYGYSGSLLTLGFSQKSTHFDWTVDLAAPILLDVPNRAIGPGAQGQFGLGPAYYAYNHNQQYSAMVFPEQAFIRLKGEHYSLRLGRFQFSDGTEVSPKDPTLAAVKRDRIDQRLIGIFGFSDVERSSDGVQYTYSNGPWNFASMAVIPTRGVFQVDGWGWVKTPYTYTALTRQLTLGKSSAEWRVFGIYYNDDRGVLKTDNRPIAVRRQDLGAINIGTFGGHFIHAIPTAAGIVDLLAWGALQTGQWGALTQRSGSGSLEAGFQPDILAPLHPWIRGGYFYSSGDSNPDDGTHGTFFAILPTPRIYARFPFFNEMNDRDLFAELILRPHKRVTTRSDVHALSLANASDFWYTGGGAFQPWTFGFVGRPSNGKSGLATLYDTSADFQLNRVTTLGLYYGYAQGGAVIASIYPKGHTAQFGFVELNYRY